MYFSSQGAHHHEAMYNVPLWTSCCLSIALSSFYELMRNQQWPQICMCGPMNQWICSAGRCQFIEGPETNSSLQVLKIQAALPGHKDHIITFLCLDWMQVKEDFSKLERAVRIPISIGRCWKLNTSHSFGAIEKFSIISLLIQTLRAIIFFKWFSHSETICKFIR